MKKLLGSSVLTVLLLAILGRAGLFASLLNANYLPHSFCYLAQPGLIWTNVAADGLIAASYALLFGCLLCIGWQLKDVADLRAYLWIVLSFGVFIAACGATHLMEVVTIWLPAYPFSAAVKVLCAAASVPTAILFARVTPTLVLKIPILFEKLSKTQEERDRARADLIAWEAIAIERARSDALIHEAYARMNHIMDSTSEGIFKLQFDWTILYANRHALETLPEIGIEKNYWNCYPEARGTIVEENLRRSMDERVPTEWEKFWEPHGEWFHVRCFPTEGGVSVFFTQITARKLLEQKLKNELHVREQREKAEREAREQLNHILDSTSDGILKLDMQWTIAYGNRRAFEISPDLAIGGNFWETYPGLLGTPSEDSLRAALRESRTVSYEVFYQPYDAWFSVNAFPTEAGLSLFYRATTAEKKLEAQLEQERHLREKRIEALSHLAGGLAHEISNPLAIIHGTASDLQRMATEEQVVPSLEALKATETIVKTSDRAIRILRGLRGFAREAANDPMEYASVHEIVEQAIQLQEARFSRHSIELRTEVPAELPLLLCREIQIGQILTNLLNNAYDAIVEQNCSERWVLLQVHVAGLWLEFDVTDSGMGIDEQAREHLMDAFFTTKTRGLGMGVGLSLSSAIANGHGGTLDLCNGTANTCFRLRLPAPESAINPQSAHYEVAH